MEAVDGLVVLSRLLTSVVEHVDEDSAETARKEHAEHDDDRDKSLVGLLLRRLGLSVNILLLSVNVLLRLRIIILRRVLRLRIGVRRKLRLLGSDKGAVLVNRCVAHRVKRLVLRSLSCRGVGRLRLLRLGAQERLFGIEILRRHRRLKRLVRGLRRKRLLLRNVSLSRLRIVVLFCKRLLRSVSVEVVFGFIIHSLIT